MHADEQGIGLARSKRLVAVGVGVSVGMMLGTSYPMGPFTLLDYVGLDTTLFIADILFDEFKESRFAAPTLLRQMVAAGYLGRKTGRGFYNYDAGEKPPHR